MHQKLTSATAIVLVISTGLACSLMRPNHAKEPLDWTLELEIDPSISEKGAALKQSVAIIEKRLNAFGVSNHQVVAKDGPNGRIQVSLPLLSDSDRDRIKKIINAGGRLEFVAVVSPPSPMPVQTYETKEAASASMAAQPPSSWRVLPYAERDEPITPGQASAEKQNGWVVVAVPNVVDGSDLRSASAVSSMGEDENYRIMFSLNKAGADKFGAWTAANINNYLGVVLNDEAKSIAFIKSQIFDSGEITGRFTKQSAEDLALVLQSGALPVPVKIVGEGFINRK